MGQPPLLALWPPWVLQGVGASACPCPQQEGRPRPSEGWRLGSQCELDPVAALAQVCVWNALGARPDRRCQDTHCQPQGLLPRTTPRALWEDRPPWATPKRFRAQGTDPALGELLEKRWYLPRKLRGRGGVPELQGAMWPELGLLSEAEQGQGEPRHPQAV